MMDKVIGIIIVSLAGAGLVVWLHHIGKQVWAALGKRPANLQVDDLSPEELRHEVRRLRLVCNERARTISILIGQLEHATRRMK